jgi:hypothetical protein
MMGAGTAHAKQDTLLDFGMTWTGQAQNDDSDIDTEIQRTIVWASGQYGFPVADGKYLLFGLDYKGQFINYDSFDPFVIEGNTVNHNDLPEDLHALDVSIGLLWIWSKKWSTLFKFQPGIHSDFKDIDGGDFMYTTLVIAERKYGQGNKWGLGAAYSDLLGKRTVIPIFRLFWYPTKRCFVEATLPFDLDLGYRFSKELSAGLAGKLAGYAYKLTEDDPWNDGVLSYREVQIGPYLDHRFSDRGHVRVSGGVVTAQKFEFRDKDNDDKLRDGDMDNTWYLMANLYFTM